MITIIFGPPRIGKTALMTFFLNEAAFNHERNYMMQEAIKYKNENGFNLSIPEHCVSANFDVTFRRQGYSDRKARIINPTKLGFGASDRKTHFLIPYETIGVMEAQEFFNSRRYSDFKDWQSNLFEQHGHNHLDFYLDTQRPGLIDLNIRELARFIEVRALDVREDKHFWFKDMAWTIREFENHRLLEEYMKSGKRDRTCFKQYRIVSELNVLDCYDSWSLEPKFYAGHIEDDFDLKYEKNYGDTKADYIQYLNDIEEG